MNISHLWQYIWKEKLIWVALKIDIVLLWQNIQKEKLPWIALKIMEISGDWVYFHLHIYTTRRVTCFIREAWRRRESNLRRKFAKWKNSKNLKFYFNFISSWKSDLEEVKMEIHVLEFLELLFNTLLLLGKTLQRKSAV